MQPNPDVKAHAEPAMASAEAFNPSITMRTHLWVFWARIALKHEAMAKAARKEAQQPDVDLGPLLEQEMDASLVGICASAFALEALSRELDELGLVPAATQAAWKRNQVSDAKVTLELLKLAVDTKGVVSIWRQELPWLFGVRGGSVHYRGAHEAPQPHPLGTNVAPAGITYSVENTSRAVDLLLSILERCRDKPKAKAQQWSQAAQGIIGQLIDSR
jgi:hypothetical protein